MGRRGGQASPWSWSPIVPRQGHRAARTSTTLLPADSWWIKAVDDGTFYETARAQLPRLLEGGGPLVVHPKEAA